VKIIEKKDECHYYRGVWVCMTDTNATNTNATDTDSLLAVKNVKSLGGSTPGGSSWSCTLYFQGRRIGTAAYDGWGGALRLDFNSKAAENRARKYAASLPGWMPEAGGSLLAYDLDVLIGEKVDQVLEERYLRKAVKTKIVARHVGQMRGEFHQMRGKWSVENSAEIRSMIQDYMIENGLELDEILNERFV